jgi:ubiquinol-cytochrome c reductase cytochrome b subunit
MYIAPVLRNLNKKWTSNPLIQILNSHIVDYPTPVNLTYAWSFGVCAAICLGIQILTGVFLAMHYTANVNLAFSSIEFIMRSIPQGWLIRYMHANGASFFFIVVYLHIFRGLYYASYTKPRKLVWNSGLVIFLLMMATAFMGYVLPWGQMSFWGVTVITSLFSAVPFFGKIIVKWLWGGYSIGNATLVRFFSLHFLLPFLIAAAVFLHLVLLHQNGSNNPLGVNTKLDSVRFYPYFYAKDLFSAAIFFFFFAIFVFFLPNALGHPDNYIIADPLQTPLHLVPEWYFLPFYAILRSISHKLGGILAMAAAILVLFLLPEFHKSEIRSGNFRPFHQFIYFWIVVIFLLLGWEGQEVLDDVSKIVGPFLVVAYFFLVIFGIYFASALENKLIYYKPSH